MARRKEIFKLAFGKRELNKDMVGKVKFEKNDMLALVIATATVVLPAVLIVFAGIALLVLIMFYR